MTEFATSTATTAAEPKTVPPFAVIPGAQVQEVLQGREKQVVQLVEQTWTKGFAQVGGQPLWTGGKP